MRLCPVRALKKYLSVTQRYRRGRKRLFLPLAEYKEDFNADALTEWVKALIIKVYFECSDSQAILFHCLHEMRGMAASWAALHSVSMTSIMKAVEWRSHNTFTKY